VVLVMWKRGIHLTEIHSVTDDLPT
jgi:hypothetical protein